MGVFQFESEGMTQLLMKLRPRSVEDLTAALSLYRPGPMDSIPRYLENRAHPESISYAHPILKDILDVTNGCIVYQEQVMEICRKMAGYSYGRADLVRRAMAKKKHDVMEKEREVFVAGAVKNGVSADISNSVFDEMAGFASYAFNKSHAAAYSVVAFQTAYLRCHYPVEYMAALMTAFTEYTGKLMEYIAYCRKNGIPILRPDINESGLGFTPLPDGKGIRFSLLAAKNLGRGVITSLIAERKKNGKFKNLTDLIRRMSGREFSKRCVESLIKCGALDSFPLNRRQMMENYDIIAGEAADISRNTIEGQLDFFGISDGTADSSDAEDRIPYSEEYPYDELLEMEKDILGIYISGHPLKDMAIAATAMRLPDIAAVHKMKEGQKVGFVCQVSSVKQHSAKTGAQMAFAVFEDTVSEIEAVVFPQVYASSAQFLQKGKRIFVEGKTSLDRDGNINILADRLIPEDAFMAKLQNGSKLFIRCRSTDRDIIDRCTELLRNNTGNSPVMFRFSDIGRTIAHREVRSCRITPLLLEKLFEITGNENTAVAVQI